MQPGKEPKERKLRTWKPIKSQMRCWWEKDSLFFPILQKLGGTQWDYSLKRGEKPQKPGIIFAQIEGFITGYSAEAPGINCTNCLGKSLKDRSNRHCQLRPSCSGHLKPLHCQELGLMTELPGVAPPLSPNDLLLATVTDHMLSPTHFLQPLLSHRSCTLINLFMWNNYFPSSKLERIKNTLFTNNAQFKSLP